MSINQVSMVTAKGEIVLHLSSQHKLCVLQGLIIQQPVQLCPLCRGVAVLVLHGTGVEDALDVTMVQKSELDYLVYNDPLGYADLILDSGLEGYIASII